MWKVFARLQARKNLPHSYEKGSLASKARLRRNFREALLTISLQRSFFCACVMMGSEILRYAQNDNVTKAQKAYRKHANH